MNKSVLILFTLLVFIQLKSAIGAKPRFAPKYCLRFKFDCTSPQKKGHVCCLFPLPIEGNSLGDQSSIPDTVPSVKVGVQKIRPLRIPSRRNGDDSNVDEHSSKHGTKRYDVFAQSKDHSSNTHAKNNQKRKEASKKKTEEKKIKTQKTQAKRPSSTRPNRPRKPFICRRLVINCKKNPTHTCCKFEAEEEKRKQEEEENNKKVEEAIVESETTSVEQEPDIVQPVEVVTVSLEENVSSLTTVSKPVIKRKTIDNAPISPIIQNDVERQQLEASIIPSLKKEEPQFKTIQLNSREPTRNIVNTRKKIVQPVATIEAVPLDLVVEIKTPNQGKRKEPNLKDNVNTKTSENHPMRQDLNEPPSTLQRLHNGTNAPHVPLKVELPIPEDEPYKRIPAECFTMSFDCETSPSHMCCAYLQ